MSEIPQKVRKLAELVRSNGGRAMLNGGCVRDELMGVEPKDWDVEVYGIEPKKLRTLIAEIGEVNVVGESFAVYKLAGGIDVSLPRRERKQGKGHRGFIVEGDPNMSFEEACSRRDFTVNAILKDAITGEIVDPYDGRGDIERKVLRHVSDTSFAEDSLRVLRAAQFSARLTFAIADETWELCKTIDLSDIAKERIWGELEKLLLKANEPSIGLKFLYDVGAIEQLFPELQALVGVPQEPEWHPEGDVDVHTMMVVDEAAKLIEDLEYAKKVTVMLGALCHDLGKPPTTEFVDGRVRSRGHDEAGVEPTLSFLNKLGVYTLDGYDVRGQVIELVRYHLMPGMFYKAKPPVGDGAFRRLARKVEPDLLYRVAKADSLGRYPDGDRSKMVFGSEAQEWFIEKARSLNVESEAPKPILMGRHLLELGIQPSPQFKQILNEVFEMQLDGKIGDLEEAMIAAKNLIAAV